MTSMMTGSYEGLSCYTANLAQYLSGEYDAAARLSNSVRLAVRCDLPNGQLAFSHHGTPLDELPDGTRLHYVGETSPTTALAGLATEIDAYGRVLAVVDNARLPWSPAGGTMPAPHWLLVDEYRGDRWHVVDGFAGLLPAGEQCPFTGWLPTETLREAMTPPPRWTPAQEQRDRLAFGFPVPVPGGGGLRWLRREHRSDPIATRLPGQWLVDDASALPFVAGYFAHQGTRAAIHLEDLWAAAGHRVYAYQWRLNRPGVSEDDADRLRAAMSHWQRLPALLRFAVESARRGRPRPALARQAMSELLHPPAPHTASEERP